MELANKKAIGGWVAGGDFEPDEILISCPHCKEGISLTLEQFTTAVVHQKEVVCYMGCNKSFYIIVIVSNQKNSKGE